CVYVIASEAIPVSLSLASSNATLPRVMPGIVSAETWNFTLPIGIGSGERPGSVNAVEPSKIVTDQARAPLVAFWSSAPWRVAPVVGVNEKVPAAVESAVGGW